MLRSSSRPHARPLLTSAALVAGGFLLAANVFGCFMPSMSSRAKLDESVQDMNVAARFGRSDIALDYVAGKERDAFKKRHSRWGTDIRIVDVELASTERVSDGEAVLLIAYAWFRPSEGVLRTTSVRQTWKNPDGPWQLQGEECASGDLGLLEDRPVVVVRPPSIPAQFRTVTIK